jgi:hypothetical protein
MALCRSKLKLIVWGQVCCPMDYFNETMSYEPEPNYAANPKFKLLPLKDCGLSYSTSDRIVGGNTSKPGELPFVVRLGVKCTKES